LTRGSERRYNNEAMFIESGGGGSGRDEGGNRGEPWVVTALGWILPWPALIVWLCVASRVIAEWADGWPAVGCIFAAIFLSAWRGLCLLPSDGLNENRQ
jgi:hypothetical protein